jgi:hypothetical protein
MDRWTNG